MNLSRMARSLKLAMASPSSPRTGRQFSSKPVPLVFMPGMKGTHLSNKSTGDRHWLTLNGLLNMPPRMASPDRDLRLPLKYRNRTPDGSPSQDRGDLVPDGLVEYIVEGYGSVNFLPFYGHIAEHLRTIERPTACFEYDWRCNLSELAEEFHEFCEKQFPGQPVQVLAHSMGGLLAYAAMQDHPHKYAPGAVVAGVPFGTGIQYLQDLHLGYFTELNRCQQFLPNSQFTMSSHWSFFSPETTDGFVDVTNDNVASFLSDKPSIGLQSPGEPLQPPVSYGHPVEIDFYDPQEWEKHQLGVFSDSNIEESIKDSYRNHLQVQLKSARAWRTRYLENPPRSTRMKFPPLRVAASDTVPTINQVLRRWRGNRFEYDYSSGRSVPGDGRINFCGAFPPGYPLEKQIRLGSPHARQFRWRRQGGDLETILEHVDNQFDEYLCKAD
eukprot:CAMPEP_0194040604 /NCGR_PEP_ID=MMETSP0009_2-20130614/12571_1 /TAXON_ID=210454 /ORGANISM="Grammatophora oceanica, Strain CCMP 410" /LENGTH=438 /DNA_ID=CAMNT_0038683789 /DNA_START=163 /DNA_END=1476 /DNA_ORIENTATION=+